MLILIHNFLPANFPFSELAGVALSLNWRRWKMRAYLRTNSSFDATEDTVSYSYFTGARSEKDKRGMKVATWVTIGVE